MKRLVSAVLALTLLGATAASAQPRHDGFGHRGGYSRGDSWHGRGDGGALIGLGIGLFALGAIAASQHDRYQNRYEYGPPPAPPPDYDQRYNY